MNKLLKHLRRFKKDNRAAIYAWIVVTVSIFAYSVIWFTAGWGVLEVMDTVETNFDLGDGQKSFDLIGMVYAYHPFIVIFGFLLYGFASSVRKDVRIDVGYKYEQHKNSSCLSSSVFNAKSSKLGYSYSRS